MAQLNKHYFNTSLKCSSQIEISNTCIQNIHQIKQNHLCNSSSESIQLKIYEYIYNNIITHLSLNSDIPNT